MPTIGSTVHFVLASGPSILPSAAGEHRPAIVLRCDRARVNLRVFLDLFDTDYRTESMWVGDVEHSAHCEPGTWHWSDEDTES